MSIVKDRGYNAILKGDCESALYKKQELSEYDNNPYIEALPKIFTEDDVIDNFSVIPIINSNDKNKEIHINSIHSDTQQKRTCIFIKQEHMVASICSCYFKNITNKIPCPICGANIKQN